jgi:hypothetical protein
MPRGNYRQTIRCAGPGCGETVTYRHGTRADEAASVKSQRESPWKCPRHLWPDQVLGRGREVIAGAMTVIARPDARNWETPRIWEAPGWPFRSDSISGPGFRAFASDWPEGTRLEVTARILPPEGTEAAPSGPRPFRIRIGPAHLATVDRPAMLADPAGDTVADTLGNWWHLAPPAPRATCLNCDADLTWAWDTSAWARADEPERGREICRHPDGAWEPHVAHAGAAAATGTEG